MKPPIIPAAGFWAMKFLVKPKYIHELPLNLQEDI
jgi:hypothetical protein